MAKPPAKKPKPKAEKKPKLTNAERRKRFVEMAHEVDALEEPKDFGEAVKKIAANTSKGKRHLTEY